MIDIFICYRRAENEAAAGRLYDRLSKAFRAKHVFKDSYTIEIGTDFEADIDNALSEIEVLLVIIGPGWAKIRGEDGRPRLFDEGDYVRLEIEKALARNIRVLPVLVGGASMPKVEDLPGDIQGLARRQAVSLSSTQYEGDIAHLIEGLRGRNRKTWLLAGAASILVLLGITLLVVLLGNDDFTYTCPVFPSPQDAQVFYACESLDKDCADFATRQEAQCFYEACRGLGGENDPHGLDLDRDSKACERLRSAPPVKRELSERDALDVVTRGCSELRRKATFSISTRCDFEIRSVENIGSGSQSIAEIKVFSKGMLYDISFTATYYVYWDSKGDYTTKLLNVEQY